MITDLTNAAWRKSNRSSASGEDCVEVAAMPGVVAVRDSKDPGPALIFGREAWELFARDIRAGAYTV
ncbi:DUF397 domain-containing protein [Spirillospora sp. CA-294931]|uniref:DUF397 domain-containing protein n=1 Tax=Spirillospora sp. CA-294931 TaxID=3240042 RepID=UPI003D919A15